MLHVTRRLFIASLFGLAWSDVASAQIITVNFDNPPPPATMDGVFQGIDFGTGQWQGSGPYNVNPTNHIYFADSTARRGLFGSLRLSGCSTAYACTARRREP